MTGLLSLPCSLGALVFILLLPRVIADPATIGYSDCFDEDNGNVTQKFSINTIYAQVFENEEFGKHLNLTVLGEAPQDIQGLTTSSSSLATLFTSTSVLTLNAWTNSSYLCTTLRPPSPLPLLPSNTTVYCPIPAGPFAFSSTIPWGKHRALTTLNTRLRAVDPFSAELFCIDVSTTPLDPEPGNPYGRAKIIFWATVALVIAYWVVVGIARIVSAWGRGITRHERGIWSRAQSAGYILASAISGERLATSPALMRFCTPSMRDIMFHTQWCSILAMVAVEWPNFIYPILTQTAWSTLSYNITLVPSAAKIHWDPLSTLPYSPPSNFADQLADISSPLFIDPFVSNTLFTLPENTTHGLSSFAYTIGVRPQDLFPNCLILFLAIIAATIVLAILVWFVDYLACTIGDTISGPGSIGPNSINRGAGARSPGFSNIKDIPEGVATSPEENKSLNGHSALGPNIFRTPSRFALPLSAGSTGDRGINSHRPWWKFRSDIGAFHGSVLHGNLVRILVLFHLPVTIFSCYQMTMSRSQASLTSIVLAALSFALFSVIIPGHLVLRVTFTTTNKLYDETRTLLSLGPLYNHYRHGSQMFASLFFATNLAFGITIGAGQKSGTAQAIIILVVEVVSALVTSVWLPWGSGASMGLISFLFCVARIVVAVLLVILTPTISIGEGAGGWVAYGILVILALVFLALLLMLVVKLVEAAVRIIGGVGFDRSRHVVDSGLLGACGLLGCCGPRKKRRRRRSRSRRHPYKATELQSQPEHRDSDVSSYIPPAFPGQGGAATPPRFLGNGSRKGSTHSGPPPSVLKPEHAMRPYREDSEDEGYIMGAWQPYPKPSYTPVLTDAILTDAPTNIQHHQKPSQSTTTVAQSGFSRVGGGRAHIDTPYAITAGSTHTFPSIGQHSNIVPAAFLDDDDDSPPPSFSNVGRHHEMAALPPGAMQPSHIRTKSQTAIIEDAGLLATLQGLGPPPGRAPQQRTPQPSQDPGSGGLLRPPVMAGVTPNYDDDDSEDLSTPKKKPWYRIGRNRVHSSEGSSGTSAAPAAPASMPVDEELGGLSATPQPARSFVVIRKPQAMGARPGGENVRGTHATT
ncbi:hypothetical protein BDZ94DRAFT_1262280 [Collybia nuda]|uniref:TRP C-terminal domain-containing protein n=1 Tax=Collybia nuda TaxID=64659 RepID=A0A9P5Y4F1_9AGAR|nr:hypothetical protein BDZ94DRAFT_1262280 [Collybia nuda]